MEFSDASYMNRYITITPVDDALTESNETIILTITGGSGYNIGSPYTATVTIKDND